MKTDNTMPAILIALRDVAYLMDNIAIQLQSAKGMHNYKYKFDEIRCHIEDFREDIELDQVIKTEVTA